MRRVAEYIWRGARCLGMWSNTASLVWFIVSIKSKAEENSLKTMLIILELFSSQAWLHFFTFQPVHRSSKTWLGALNIRSTLPQVKPQNLVSIVVESSQGLDMWPFGHQSQLGNFDRSRSVENYSCYNHLHEEWIDVFVVVLFCKTVTTDILICQLFARLLTSHWAGSRQARISPHSKTQHIWQNCLFYQQFFFSLDVNVWFVFQVATIGGTKYGISILPLCL